MKYFNITYPDVNNGIGCRCSLWISGCTHHCKGCHNKETWNFSSGKEFTSETKDKLFNILKLPYIKGLTLTGGDPLDSFDDVLTLVIDIKSSFKDKDIWLYTGYSLEDIKNSNKSDILSYVDFIVDGEYKESLRDISIAFRGSTNQTIWEKDENNRWFESILNN